MLGKKSGVATKFKELYPTILSWPYMRHRLELVVSDAEKSVTTVNHFKAFVVGWVSVYGTRSRKGHAVPDKVKSWSQGESAWKKRENANIWMGFPSRLSESDTV